MIKLADLLNGTMRDPFTGELYEGLIKTVEIHKAVELLSNSQIPIVTDVDITKQGEIVVLLRLEYPDQRIANYVSGAIHNEHLSNLFKLINNLGYYITVYSDGARNYKYSPTSFREWVNREEPTKMVLLLSAKYDEKIEKLPPTVFHVTNTKYLSKIKQVGLKPTTQSKLASHPDRIYLALTKDAAHHIADAMKTVVSGYDPVILTINTSKLPENLNFYNDPHFSEQGVYTLGNIPPSAITNI